MYQKYNACFIEAKERTVSFTLPFAIQELMLSHIHYLGYVLTVVPNDMG